MLDDSQRSHLEREGYLIFRDYIPVDNCEAAVKAVYGRVYQTLSGYAIPKLGKMSITEALIAGMPQFGHSPKNWKGQPFGSYSKKGWIKRVGSGRMFDDWKDPLVMHVQDQVRPLAAALHRCSPESLVQTAERCSIKVFLGATGQFSHSQKRCFVELNLIAQESGEGKHNLPNSETQA